jgi:hypothetical protein
MDESSGVVQIRREEALELEQPLDRRECRRLKFFRTRRCLKEPKMMTAVKRMKTKKDWEWTLIGALLSNLKNNSREALIALSLLLQLSLLIPRYLSMYPIVDLSLYTTHLMDYKVTNDCLGKEEE